MGPSIPFREDGGRQARLYGAAGPAQGYGDTRETTAYDLGVAATKKAKRRRIIGVTLFLVVMGLIAAYLIFRILAQ